MQSDPRESDRDSRDSSNGNQASHRLTSMTPFDRAEELQDRWSPANNQGIYSSQANSPIQSEFGFPHGSMAGTNTRTLPLPSKTPRLSQPAYTVSPFHPRHELDGPVSKSCSALVSNDLLKRRASIEEASRQPSGTLVLHSHTTCSQLKGLFDPHIQTSTLHNIKQIRRNLNNKLRRTSICNVPASNISFLRQTTLSRSKHHPPWMPLKLQRAYTKVKPTKRSSARKVFPTSGLPAESKQNSGRRTINYFGR